MCNLFRGHIRNILAEIGVQPCAHLLELLPRVPHAALRRLPRMPQGTSRERSRLLQAVGFAFSLRDDAGREVRRLRHVDAEGLRAGTAGQLVEHKHLSNHIHNAKYIRYKSLRV